MASGAQAGKALGVASKVAIRPQCQGVGGWILRRDLEFQEALVLVSDAVDDRLQSSALLQLFGTEGDVKAAASTSAKGVANLVELLLKGGADVLFAASMEGQEGLREIRPPEAFGSGRK